MKNMKKIISFILTISLLMTLFCTPVFAEPEEVALNDWFAALKNAASYCKEHNFKYKVGGKDKSKTIDCAGYVSRAMREMKWLPDGKVIWLDENVNGNGKKSITGSDDFKILHPDKATSTCYEDGTLQPGDIAGYHWKDNKGKHHYHTMVYVGNKKWYSFGPSQDDDWNTGPMSKGSYNDKKVRTIVRYKNFGEGSGSGTELNEDEESELLGASDTTNWDAVQTLTDDNMELLYGNHDEGDTSATGSVIYGNAGGGKLGYPLPKKYPISSNFGYRSASSTNGVGSTDHKGIDIAAPGGTKILAAEEGEVILAKYYGGFGNCVQIKHAGGVVTIYGHMSKIKTTKGKHVQKGELIGLVGTTGHSTGNHLHFQVEVNGKPVDPKPWIGLK